MQTNVRVIFPLEFQLHELAQMIENNLKGNDLTRDGELQNIHDFLSLYSAYQTIVLIHDIKKDELKCYAECFTVDHEDLLVIHEFLLLTKTRLEALIAKKERLKECNSVSFTSLFDIFVFFTIPW